MLRSVRKCLLAEASVVWRSVDWFALRASWWASCDAIFCWEEFSNGLCMFWNAFPWRLLCGGQSIGVCCWYGFGYGFWYGFLLKVFFETGFLIVLISYLLKLSLGHCDNFCSCCRFLWTTTLEEFIIFIIINFVVIIIIILFLFLLLLSLLLLMPLITFLFYCPFLFLAHEYLINLILIRYFINVKSVCKKNLLFI